MNAQHAPLDLGSRYAAALDKARVIAAATRDRLGLAGLNLVMVLTLDGLIQRKRDDLAAARAALAPRLEDRSRLVEQIAELRGQADARSEAPNADESRQILALDQQRQAIDAETAEQRAAIGRLVSELENLEREQAADAEAQRLAAETRDTGARAPYDGVVRVTGEERTYTRRKAERGEASIFRDAWAAESGSWEARERLQRNSQEAKVEGELSERATSTGSFGGMVVPQYLVDMFAPVLRAGRPFANACQGMPLPAQGMTLDVPRATTGVAEAAQATENTAVQNTDMAVTDLIVPVRTIAGQQDVSRQSLERGTPGIDLIIYRDLAAAYHAELDRQVIAGTGASGQMLGVMNTAGVSSATAYGAAITYTSFNSKIAGQIAAIAASGTGIVPKMIAINPRRWGWMSTLVDSAGRPLILPTANGLLNAGGINLQPGAYGGDGDNTSTVELNAVGAIQGLPIFTDANVPTTVGTNNEDVAIVFDPAQALLWEDGDGQPREFRFDGPLSANLTVKLISYGYCAFTAGRYASAFGYTGGKDSAAGNGQVAPTY